MAGNKYTRGGSNSFDIKPTDDSILIGEVIDIDDPNDGGRIKVFIKGLDDKEFDFNNSGDIDTKKELSHLPHAFPLLPKFLNVMPKIGESVFVLLTNKDNKYSGRMWIGPIISQPESLDEDPYLTSLSNLTQGANISLITFI